MWSNPDCDSAELLRLLLYYTSTLRYEPPPASQLTVEHSSSNSLPVWNRKEVGALGLTALVDARGAAPVPALFSALRSLQVSLITSRCRRLCLEKVAAVALL